MARALTEESNIMGQIPEVIAWMSSLGLRARNSRYARYEEHINAFFKQGYDPASEEGALRWQHLTQAYRECLDICLVYRCFKDVRHPSLIKTLSHVISGQDVPDPHDAAASRNFLFELLVAARFHLAGYAIEFGEKGDVVARRGPVLVRAECKRLVSEAQLVKRIKYAAGQLEEVVDAEKGEIGLIFVDVSACIASDARTMVETRIEARDEIRNSLQRLVVRNGNNLETLNAKHQHVSHGTCLVGVLPIWSDGGVLNTCMGTRVVVAKELSVDKYNALRFALANFEEAFVKAFH
ncbi:hypothetical protein IAE60_12640 [Pseudoxanthomonas mexicana]|uniref:Uncharacterized protein n=1 Tax=Pseudoxanthomonas mexicana TaxID=128785 RepID=A0A7G9T9L1_PSEMX|nr:hypothetical protein [Pseudoxanthomonas mexicana]QNN76786.1 hypothetical protein IAE60_12640 [Pseudoxanthomonas mexicana]